jgi:hypothetical protein
LMNQAPTKIKKMRLMNQAHKKKTIPYRLVKSL